MSGAVIIVVVLVLVLPVLVLMGTSFIAGGLGFLLGRDRDLDNRTDDGEPNEYLVLSDADPWAEASE